MNHLSFTALLAAAMLSLAGCGGGAGADAAAPGSVSLAGTAATGAAIASASLKVKCSSDSGKIVSGTVLTALDGSYKIVIPEAQKPCLLEVSTKDGVRLHAVSSGLSGVANITPLTETLVAMVLEDGNLADWFDNLNPLAMSRLKTAAAPENLDAAWTKVKAVLVARNLDVGAIGSEPTTAALSAAVGGVGGNGYDALLDKINALSIPASPYAFLGTTEKFLTMFKIDSKGAPLKNQFGKWSDLGTAVAGTQWDCVHDTVTGLFWEVKRNDPLHLRHKAHLYTWFDTRQWLDPVSNKAVDLNGGSAGTETNRSCQGVQDATKCNTSSYVKAVNAAALCGFTDWSLPDIDTLQRFPGNAASVPAINSDYFPDLLSDPVADIAYWSSTPSANTPDGSNAWHLSLGTGKVEDGLKSSARPVRLVRTVKPPDILAEDMGRCHPNIAPMRPDSRYKVAGGEVSDTLTKLVWKQCVEGLSGAACSGDAKSYTLAQARAAASAAAPWRLPTKSELASLVDRKCTGVWKLKDDSTAIWMSTRIFTVYGSWEQESSWSAPVRIAAPSDTERVQFSIDRKAWHYPPTAADVYMRADASSDKGATWKNGAELRILRETGVGWSDAVPTDDGRALWMSSRLFTPLGADPQDASWSVPKQLPKLVTAGNAPGVEFSTDAKTWHYPPTSDDVWMRADGSTDKVLIKGEAGGAPYVTVTGAGGKDTLVSAQVKGVAFMRSDDTPSTPTGGSFASPTPLIFLQLAPSGQGMVKGVAFYRGGYGPVIPAGGSFSYPTPASEGWTDGIPAQSSVQEFESAAGSQQAVNAVIFPQAPASGASAAVYPQSVWTSTAHTDIGSAAWIVNFYTGSLNYIDQATKGVFVRLVKSAN